MYINPRVRGFFVSAKLLSVVACGYAFHSVIPFLLHSEFLNFFFHPLIVSNISFYRVCYGPF
ncbi:hypothetical protein CMV59_03875 [Escherichia coli]|nr:hypothetical protein CMV59_03875 [Escherichia coli]